MSIYLLLRFGLLQAYNITPTEYENFPENYYLLVNTLLMLVVSGLLALILALIDLAITDRIINRQSFIVLVLGSVVSYVVVLGGVIYGVDQSIHLVYEDFSGQETQHLSTNELLLSSVVLAGIIAFSRIVIELDRKLGPGNLWKFITGKFYTPREEERIFMFIDLKGSTTIAEKLGHFKYSELLRDCFNDLSIVDKYHAEVYQYVGDEVVLSWPVSRSRNYEKFLSAFFAFQGKLNEKKEHYTRAYGLIPFFKAGVHAGPAIVTEVGQIKRELTYHGDTLNTAARIQGKCSELNSQLLVSEKLRKIVESYSPYHFEDVGCISLKGKEEPVRLFNVTQ